LLTSQSSRMNFTGIMNAQINQAMADYKLIETSSGVYSNCT